MSFVKVNLYYKASEQTQVQLATSAVRVKIHSHLYLIDLWDLSLEMAADLNALFKV